VSDDAPFRLPPVDPTAATVVPAASLSPELLAGLLADGDDELAAWTLRHALAEESRVDVYDGLLRDAMALVGERWSEGRWSIAEEHLASRTLLRTLDRVGPDLGPERRIGPVAVLAGVAGEQHMIGLVCLEHVLAEAGWTVANLASRPRRSPRSSAGRSRSTRTRTTRRSRSRPPRPPCSRCASSRSSPRRPASPARWTRSAAHGSSSR
jgi:hypothetical protein